MDVIDYAYANQVGPYADECCPVCDEDLDEDGECESGCCVDTREPEPSDREYR